ncbi:hypothetical protein QE152_g13712 [Popillia japonica]|uniref:PHD-type domain-containing protein n=1 Tax=Popillia japonica TaxID=7064 RepID=A0AAW1LAZ0_POPJA
MFAATLPTSHDAPQNNNTTENDAVAAVMLEMGNAMENIQQDFVRESTPEEQIIGQNKEPSTSSVYNIISPETIAPYTKAGRVKSLKKKVGRRRKAAVLTSSPYKEELKKSLAEKNRKNNIDKLKTNTVQTLKNKNSANSSSSKAKKQMPNSKVTKVSKDQSSSSESDVDVDCLFCGNNYSKDRCGEGWIMCCHCGKWAHDACAGVGSDDDDEFTCDLCRQK